MSTFCPALLQRLRPRAASVRTVSQAGDGEDLIGKNLWVLCIDCQVLAAACIMEGGGGCRGAFKTWGHRQLEGASMAYEADMHAGRGS